MSKTNVFALFGMLFLSYVLLGNGICSNQIFVLAQENEAEGETDIEQENKCKKDSECKNENELNNSLTITNITQAQQQEESQTALNIIKTLECQNEGTPLECLDLVVGDFVIAITGNNPNPSEFPGSSEGIFVTLGSGDYTVSETTNVLFPPLTEWSASFSGDCTKSGEFAGEGTIDEGETQTCTIHNTVNFIAD